MATKYKGVSGGTPTGDPLCRTCRNAMFVRGKSEGQEALFCDSRPYGAPKMDWEAFECSKYDDSRMPALHDLYQTAWILESDKRTKKIGFVSPQDKRHQEIRNTENLY